MNSETRIFNLRAPYKPTGDQPEAIKALTKAILNNERHNVLLGVTGSGKTFTVANVLARLNRPVLVISHNKTLTAQLYSEFKQFFPDNAVEYFVSYYDYYQPEAYIPQTDMYIDKDADINEQIDRLRLKATTSVFERRDVIVVASVSCIYGIGSPEDFRSVSSIIQKEEEMSREHLLEDFIDMQYERNEIDFGRGKFRVRGDIVEIFPAYLETALRVEFFGNTIEKLLEIDPLTGKTISEKERVCIYPAKHFVTPRPRMLAALEPIRKELAERVAELKSQGRLLEAQRLESRTNYDLEMLEETGFCHGIENYSRHLAGRKPGEPPACLINYFPDDFITIIDESHMTIPQLNGMYQGDRSRKETLVEYGFRLPSALDNRPLKFGEFSKLVNQAIYVSATPAPYELKQTKGKIIEQVVRPTGLVDPEVIVKPAANQVDDLVEEVEKRVQKEQRVLVTTLTKRMAEDLCSYLMSKDFKVRYLHSEVQTLDRIEILLALRKGEFDVLVGVNLLREGLDLPEVTLVAVLDADKEGFLRNETSLIQVSGRAARNVDGQVILYADTVTGSMKRAMMEMKRRRKKQLEYNKKHNITPRTIEKAIQERRELVSERKKRVAGLLRESGYEYVSKGNVRQQMAEVECQMKEAAENLDFELAMVLRDRLFAMREVVGPGGKKHKL
jgi:excinuclease ABC subunit B